MGVWEQGQGQGQGGRLSTLKNIERILNECLIKYVPFLGLFYQEVLSRKCNYIFTAGGDLLQPIQQEEGAFDELAARFYAACVTVLLMRLGSRPNDSGDVKRHAENSCTSFRPQANFCSRYLEL